MPTGDAYEAYKFHQESERKRREVLAAGDAAVQTEWGLELEDDAEPGGSKTTDVVDIPADELADG